MSARFEITDTPLPDLKLLRRKQLLDSRGFLERLFCADELNELMGTDSIVQINRTHTLREGTVRGLHFQYPPHAETKLVSCLKGRVFDVAVDVRRGSPTFLQWHAEILAEDDGKTFLIPRGFAHGFQTLMNHCELLYLHTAVYVPSAEAGIDARDPAIAIAWPIPIAELSDRDAHHRALTPGFNGIP